MKAIVKNIFLFLLVIQVQAQQVPSIKVGEEKLGISSLDIKVDVIGNIATTTYDMLFYNPTNTILEGELAFPLGENQNVSRLALEVNGKLREAVVVKKEQGRIAFEAVVRRGVDPVLLEKGTGNNYKARIYPIPAKGYKRIVLAYEQELILSEDSHYVQLPLEFKKQLDHFSLEMTVFNQKEKPFISEGSLDNFRFSSLSSNFYAKVVKKNFIPKSVLVIKIPETKNEEKVLISDDYFYAYKTLNKEKRARNKPKSIALYWDASLSMKDRDIEKEFSFLEKYISYLQNVNIDLVIFSNAINFEKKYEIEKGNWNSLKFELKNTIYDGGTSYSNLFVGNNKDETLLFSDGMNNLSDIYAELEQPLFVVNSLLRANHSELNKLCSKTNGKYINLKTNTINDAIFHIKYELYKFLGVETLNKAIEVYPNTPQIVSQEFSIAGKNANENDIITVLFGYGNEVSKKETIRVSSRVENTLVKRIWAQKKLKVLQEESETNKTEIISHSKSYNLVSNHTSLIVLETVWDYVRYKITPPEELLEAYNKILKKNKGIVKVESNTPEIDENVSSNTVDGNISGVISDENGLPLPGVNIIKKGTSEGAQTDFDGRYSLNAKRGDVLVYAFVGYSSAEVDVNTSNVINFSMRPDIEAIDEVVVTALGISSEKKSVTYSSQSISGKELSQSGGTNVVQSLQGRVAGLNVQRSNNGLNLNTQIVLRGARSLSGNNQALIVIDGVISKTEDLQFMNPNDIESVNVVKGLSATALYGSRASNGAIIVSTKFNSNNTVSRNSTSNETEKINPYKGNLKVKEIENNVKYIKELKRASSLEEAYSIYLNQRANYKNVPAYYIDVFDYFKRWNSKKHSLKILTNIAEIDFDNYELLRVLAYKLESVNNYGLAAYIFNQVLNLRPEDSQSYRDLALAYQEIGMHKEAFNLLNSIVNRSIYKKEGRRVFKGVEDISTNEMNRLIQKHKDIDANQMTGWKQLKADFDIRVVIDWNHNDTDIDLYVIDPNLEECSYKHTKTKIGGEISQDMTQGFGPEEFVIRNAAKGAYFVKVNYYGDNYQKIENPTFMKVTLFKNFGRPSETKEIKIIRLTKSRDNQIVARLDV